MYGAYLVLRGICTLRSGTIEGIHLQTSATEIREILSSSKRGSYRKYNDVFRFFAEKVAIPEMVENAAKEDFPQWLPGFASQQALETKMKRGSYG
jgi:hypothetical protein